MNPFYIAGLLVLLFTYRNIDAENEKSAPISDTASLIEEEILSEGEFLINGKKITYQAAAGIYRFKEIEDVKARIFYIAYTRKGQDPNSKRPVAFCFNGGPGASSVWMHMGMLGPKRVALKDGVADVPPFRFIDNDYSLLDEIDLVFIDPISTGYSRTDPVTDDKKFHSVDTDVKSVAEFIRLYTTRNAKWDSPKFLIGASYGTLRAVELINYLFDKFNMAVNGAVLVSSALNFESIEPVAGSNELPFPLFLPSYTAAAWHYKKLSPALQENLSNTLEQAKKFAATDYTTALFLGSKLPTERRKQIVEKLSLFTSLSPERIENSDLRIKPTEFFHELLKQEGKVIGRFDARISGNAINRASSSMEYDPSMDAIFSAFTATFNQYVREDLKWIKDDEYRVLANVFPWNYGKDSNRYFTALPTLREMMIRIPSLSIFVASGYFDLATPFYSAEYNIDHLNIPGNLSDRLTMKYYPGGHMIYTDLQSLQELSKDLHAYIKNTLTKKNGAP